VRRTFLADLWLGLVLEGVCKHDATA
jgi:hypothetical protein